MKIKIFLGIAIGCFCMIGVAFAQTSVVISDPVAESAKAEHAAVNASKIELSAAEQALMDNSILPKARAKLKSEVCEESIDISSRVQGAFTKAGAKQTLIFYQFCQTGNGLGSVGVAIIDNGKVVGNFVSVESGWTDHANVLPDINQNGLDEIALYYSGGMHQGAGGTGVDIIEYSNGALKGIGWFQAEGFTETGPVIGYRVTVAPGKTPAFFKEKYTQDAAGKWKKTGTAVPLKLTKAVSEFVSVI